MVYENTYSGKVSAYSTLLIWLCAWEYRPCFCVVSANYKGNFTFSFICLGSRTWTRSVTNTLNDHYTLDIFISLQPYVLNGWFWPNKICNNQTFKTEIIKYQTLTEKTMDKTGNIYFFYLMFTTRVWSYMVICFQGTQVTGI